ncbi:2-succinyl-6-hydroxy-2,4-cyclohexadiene-1-carboxylate synthase [Aliifodinibius salipaludis]|uniref:2-succinyl-6-hydroxy-2,4-cyclohexadiene-1-carboxylate synthase n=1 Tax=Fodinibius salipaludis TaxID=2032627 RepID=A0A2A2GFC6_9BACT|nr:2-succinyl-6-hydroxy-2,4-cyclohexadiene-1-carboxylate synthase [Aliifodinibius salipaludis]PAU95694.1 2-succinyl-6-hydroxy-2,4-cyclohexadiene-1-carboxylate synthase [Aliifodinibius salipaludis]
MEQISVNNQEYAVYVHQHNDTLPYLLMLHGFMGDHRVFDHLIDELCELYNPVTIDLLGHGASSNPSDPSRYNEDNQIKDIVSIIQTKNLSPLFLYGYSMGGRLALKVTLNSPSLFNGLILESTNCGISDSQKRKERQKADGARARQIKEDFEQFLADWSKLNLFKSPLPVDKSLARKYQHIQHDQSPGALAASLNGFGTGSMSPVCHKLSELNLPTLLLGGSADEKYQGINQYLADQLPNATFWSIKAGHRIHLNNPSILTNRVNDFLRSL